MKLKSDDAMLMLMTLQAKMPVDEGAWWRLSDEDKLTLYVTVSLFT